MNGTIEREVKKLKANGCDVSTIASAVGISESQVQQILGSSQSSTVGNTSENLIMLNESG